MKGLLMRTNKFVRIGLLAGPLAFLFTFFCDSPVNPYKKPYKITFPEGPYYVGVAAEGSFAVEGDGLDSVTVSPVLPDSLVLDVTTGVFGGTPWSAVDEDFTVTAYNQHGQLQKTWHLVINDTNIYLDTTSTPAGGGSIEISPEPTHGHPTRCWYDRGTAVSVKAVPAPGYKFGAWTGDHNGGNPTASLVLDSSISLSAVFSQVEGYSITTSVTPENGGSISVSPKQTSYEEDSEVTILAEPSDGYTFIRWEGDLSGSAMSNTLTIDSDKSVTAVFGKETYTLIIERAGNGEILMGEESPAAAPESMQVESGTSVYLTARPNEGHVFSGWTGAMTGTTNPISISVSGNTKITGNFTEEGRLTINGSVSPENSGKVSISPLKDSYDPEESVSLKAVPAEGYRFVKWSGDVTGPFDSVSVVMDGNKLYTAEFEPIPHTITVTINGKGAVLPASPIAVNHFETETLKATPANGYRFAGWEGDASGTESAIEIYVDSDKELTALFEPIDTFAVSVSSNPSGGGSFTVTPEKETYSFGEEITVEALAADGYDFDTWSGASTSDLNTIRLTVEESIELVGKFHKKSYTVAIIKEGEGTVTPAGPTINAEYNEEVTLTASPSEGYNFLGWAGDAESSNNPLTVSVTKSMSIKAVFAEKDKYAVVTTVSPAEAGSASKSPNKTSYIKGEQVELSAEPATGYDFVEWRLKDTTMSAATFTLDVDTNYNLTAVFRAKKYSVTVNAGEGGSVSRDKTGKIAHGETVRLTAVAETGHRFVSWGGDASGSANPYDLTVDGAKTVSATFGKIDDYTITASISPEGKGSISFDPPGPKYEYQEDVSLLATPSTGYRLKSWGGDVSDAGSSPEAILTVVKSHSISATFEKIPYRIKMQVEGSGTVTPSTGDYTKYHGDEIEISASPSTGYKFDGWAGDVSGKDSPKTITVTSGLTIRAVFSKENEYTIVPTVTPEGSGKVNKNPNSSYYTYEDEVTLTAVPAEGYRFVEWENGLSGTSPSKTYTVTSSIQPRAIFEKKTYTLTVTKDGSGSISPSGEVTVEHGEPRSINANPSGDYLFDKWIVKSGTATIANDGSKVTTVTLTGNASVQANFKLQPKTATPSISPAAGTYQDDITVSISCATSDATIYYTTNNTTPTTSSAQYSGSFILSSDAVVRAIGKAPDHRVSNEVSAEYAMNQPPSITIDAPASGELLGGWIVFEVTPSDPEGKLDKVEFKKSGSVLGSTDAGSGWVWTWDNATAGLHTIEAIVYDESGGSASASVTFSVCEWEELATIPSSVGVDRISLAMTGSGAPYVGTQLSEGEYSDYLMRRKLYKYQGADWESWNFNSNLYDLVYAFQLDVSQNDHLFLGYPETGWNHICPQHLKHYNPATNNWDSANISIDFETVIGIGAMRGTNNAIAAFCTGGWDDEGILLYKYGASGWNEMTGSGQVDGVSKDGIWVAGIGQNAYLLTEDGDCYKVDDAGIYTLDGIPRKGRGLAVANGNIYASAEKAHVYKIAPGAQTELPAVYNDTFAKAEIAGDGDRLFAAYIDDGARVKEYVDGAWVNFPKGTNGVVSTESGISNIKISAKDGELAVAVISGAGVKVYRLNK